MNVGRYNHNLTKNDNIEPSPMIIQQQYQTIIKIVEVKLTTFLCSLNAIHVKPKHRNIKHDLIFQTKYKKDSHENEVPSAMG